VAERVIVTVHLPLEMGAVGRILKAVAREYPDSVIDQTSGGNTFAIRADDDARLTPADRRRIAKARRP
jgi:hypothetical protein